MIDPPHKAIPPQKNHEAVLQFEFDRQRVNEMTRATGTVMSHVLEIAWASMLDTYQNGGTFVFVVSDKTITIVQRPKEAAQ